ncbi:thiamine pyrophosphate-dependent enzyme [Streptomyces sp. NPDC048636]|uniref:thiamine pyrophosphate-dependent enzyme n=1 Tax=Streptomyces sp. NPDC048636 TaxID=3155762 RepID=UPI00341623D2
MMRVRLYEAKAASLRAQGLAPALEPLPHCGESVVVGVIAAMRDEDRVTSVSSGHAALIAKNTRPDRLWAGVLGRPKGCARGHGLLAHFFDISHGLVGANGLAEQALVTAVGTAWADQEAGRDHITVVLCDAHLSPGWYEATLMAREMRLPVLFVRQHRSAEPGDPATPVAATPGDLRAMRDGPVDAGDVLEVHRAAESAVRRVRGGGGPGLLEIQLPAALPRLASPESMGGDGAPATDGAYPEDPIAALAGQLIAAGVLTRADVDRLRAEEAATVDGWLDATDTGHPDDGDAGSGLIPPGAGSASIAPSGDVGRAW